MRHYILWCYACTVHPTQSDAWSIWSLALWLLFFVCGVPSGTVWKQSMINWCTRGYITLAIASWLVGTEQCSADFICTVTGHTASVLLPLRKTTSKTFNQSKVQKSRQNEEKQNIGHWYETAIKPAIQYKNILCLN